MKKVSVLGCGRLGTIVARGLSQNVVKGATLHSVFSRTPEKAQALANELSCRAAMSIEEMLSGGVDYVIEAATSLAVQKYTISILTSGADIIVLSTGAFSNQDFYTQVWRTAEQYDRRVHLAPGVVGGFDIMAAAKLRGKLDANLTKRKHTRSSGEGDPALNQMDDFFCGSASEAYQRFPDHFNIAVSVALATCGLENTRVGIETVRPGENVNFTTELAGDFGKALIYTELGSTGPELAAWSALATLEKRMNRIGF